MPLGGRSPVAISPYIEVQVRSRAKLEFFEFATSRVRNILQVSMYVCEIASQSEVLTRVRLRAVSIPDSSHAHQFQTIK